MEEGYAIKRGKNWSDAEVFALIGVWRDNFVGLHAQRRNRHVYFKMNAELKEAGVERSPVDIQTKIRNLTRDYRKEKALLGSGSSNSSWKFYSHIHELLGSLLANNDQIMQDSATLEMTTQDLEEAAEVTGLEGDLQEEADIPSCSAPSLELESGNDTSSIEFLGGNAPRRRSRKRKQGPDFERNEIMRLMYEANLRRDADAHVMDRQLVSLMERQAETQDKMMQILGTMTQILQKAVD